MHAAQAESLTTLPRAWIALTLGACALLVTARLLDVYPLQVIAKLTASTAFVLIAWRVGASEHRVGRWMLVALLLSWLGDMLLLGTTSGLFMAGLVSFLLAHVAYAAAFTMDGFDRRWLLMAAIPVLIVSTLASLWLAPHLPPGMIIPVRAYTVVISAMVIMAFATRGAGATVLIPFGALLFYFSDLSVAAGQFVQTEFPNYIWGLPFYYLGQVLLALSSGPTPGTARN